MIPHSDTITEADLLAHADGQLEKSRREAVEAYLAEHPEKAAEVAAWRAQSEAIGALFNPVVSEAIPPRLNPHRLAHKTRSHDNRHWLQAVAAVLLMVFGISLGWYGRDLVTRPASPTTALMTAALEAHQLFTTQGKHPVEVPGTETAHLTTWLSASLDRRLVMPDLSLEGYQLVGGRILPAASGTTAAQVMYEAANGQRVTLYLTPKTPDQPAANTFAASGDLAALYWANDAVTCTIVGNLSRAEMEAIASDVFKALSWQDADYQFG